MALTFSDRLFSSHPTTASKAVAHLIGHRVYQQSAEGHALTSKRVRPKSMFGAHSLSLVSSHLFVNSKSVIRC